MSKSPKYAERSHVFIFKMYSRSMVDLTFIEKKDLTKMDWDELEYLIEETLNSRIRTYDGFDYFIIDPYTVLVKVYEGKNIIFTVKMMLNNGKLEIMDVH